MQEDHHTKGWLAPVVVAAGLIAAAPAPAAVVTADGAVRFTAAEGERNSVDVTTLDGVRFTVIDETATLTAGEGCTRSGTHLATCTIVPGGAGTIVVDLGDGDDAADLSALTEPQSSLTARSVTGWAGDDHITGSGSADTLDGEAGDDVLEGSGGNDRLIGRGGADRLIGGAGWDVADYVARTTGVDIAIDGQPGSGNADDGPVGARDVIEQSVEELEGGRGDDELTGDNDDNVLRGGPGADVLAGAGGEDVADYSERIEPVTAAIDGTPGAGGTDDGPRGARDTLTSSVEDIWGGAGDDTLTGDDGPNLLNGGPGRDVLNGGKGEDAADYSERLDGVTAAANDQPISGNSGDGEEGARDTVGSDIEDLLGGRGSDTLTGNDAANWLGGGAGDDLLDARGRGKDYSSCGDGTDTAWVDPDDIGAADCERIGSGPDPDPTPSELNRGPPQVRLRMSRGQSLKTVSERGLEILFTCSKTCTVNARLVLGRADARRLRLSSGRSAMTLARASAGRTGAGGGRLVLAATARVAKRMARTRRADLALLATAVDEQRHTVWLRRHLTLLPTRARLIGRGQSTKPPFSNPRGPRKRARG